MNDNRNKTFLCQFDLLYCEHLMHTFVTISNVLSREHWFATLCINPFATGDAYMRQLFHCLQRYAGSKRVNYCAVTTEYTLITSAYLFELFAS